MRLLISLTSKPVLSWGEEKARNFVFRFTSIKILENKPILLLQTNNF